MRVLQCKEYLQVGCQFILLADQYTGLKKQIRHQIYVISSTQRTVLNSSKGKENCDLTFDRTGEFTCRIYDSGFSFIYGSIKFCTLLNLNLLTVHLFISRTNIMTWMFVWRRIKVSTVNFFSFPQNRCNKNLLLKWTEDQWILSRIENNINLKANTWPFVKMSIRDFAQVIRDVLR